MQGGGVGAEEWQARVREAQRIARGKGNLLRSRGHNELIIPPASLPKNWWVQLRVGEQTRSQTISREDGKKKKSGGLHIQESSSMLKRDSFRLDKFFQQFLFVGGKGGCCDWRLGSSRLRSSARATCASGGPSRLMPGERSASV